MMITYTHIVCISSFSPFASHTRRRFAIYQKGWRGGQCCIQRSHTAKRNWQLKSGIMMMSLGRGWAISSFPTLPIVLQYYYDYIWYRDGVPWLLLLLMMMSGCQKIVEHLSQYTFATNHFCWMWRDGCVIDVRGWWWWWWWWRCYNLSITSKFIECRSCHRYKSKFPFRVFHFVYIYSAIFYSNFGLCLIVVTHRMDFCEHIYICVYSKNHV